MCSDIDGGDRRRVCLSQGEHGSLIAFSERAAFPPNQTACLPINGIDAHRGR
jgi:hypothetical protein